MSQHLFPIIAIVGRPNVGKSSLFNRLVQKRVAVTYEIAGTTRDNIYHHLDLNNELAAILVDTGGIEHSKKLNIEADVQSQARLAVKEADIILFVVDASQDLTANDYSATDLLRKSNKPLIFVSNKCDNRAMEGNTHQFLELGFGEPIKISTIHNFGIDDLEEVIEATVKKAGWKSNKPKLPAPDENDEEPIKERDFEKKGTINLSFIGRPNAGKSSLMNALLGKEKLIVSPIAGTTRDAIDIGIEWKGQSFNLIDTAGLRRRGKIDQGIEKISSMRALEAIERSDIVCLVLDFERGIGKQDQHISSYAMEAKKGLILVVNKSDLMQDKQEDQHKFLHKISTQFDFLPWVPVLFISALKKNNIEKVIELAQHVYEERFKKIDDDELDGFMRDITYKHLPPKVFAIQPKFYALKQTGVNPPTFVFWVNEGRAIHFSYRRYLENEIRKKYGFSGTSLRLIFKKKGRDEVVR